MIDITITVDSSHLQITFFSHYHIEIVIDQSNAKCLKCNFKPRKAFKKFLPFANLDRTIEGIMNFSCGCAFDKAVKEPHFKKTKHFEDLSASFAINAKNEQLGAHYSWLVQVHKPFKVTSQPQQRRPYIEATFENPTDPDHPIVVPAIQLKPTEGNNDFEKPRYYFLSPALGALRCKLYKMKITAYTDNSKSVILTEHENQLLSRINTDSCIKSEFMEKMKAAANYSEWETKQ
ncbi:hypothetical protein BDF20DRAFT_834737 [Mycotypha africana]|uniref:uncharacterized protein n=1 Tax=Mycotypha africana TaxID=64632 RepID=UPI0023011C23|nr:uncharacterized protein BDF20DRAFT_834737 [Mycotypha africana]KAI8982082.1 hypothetical protein BDF20DRAFT_834737 [Mycotypha africana]